MCMISYIAGIIYYAFFLMSGVSHGKSHFVLVSLCGMCNLILYKMISLNLVQSSSTVLVSVELKSELFNKEVKPSFMESQLALWYRYISLGFCLLILDLISISMHTNNIMISEAWKDLNSILSIGVIQKNKSSILCWQVGRFTICSSPCSCVPET